MRTSSCADWSRPSPTTLVANVGPWAEIDVAGSLEEIAPAAGVWSKRDGQAEPPTFACGSSWA
jgi:hypothetical protein